MTITLSAIVIWLLIGLVVGGIAHLLVPGRNRIGILLTILVGVVGAIVGGLITAAILGAGPAIITFIVSLIVPALLIAAHRPAPALPHLILRFPPRLRAPEALWLGGSPTTAGPYPLTRAPRLADVTTDSGE